MLWDVVSGVALMAERYLQSEIVRDQRVWSCDGSRGGVHSTRIWRRCYYGPVQDLYRGRGNETA